MRYMVYYIGLFILTLLIAVAAAQDAPKKTGFWGRALIKQSEGFLPCKYDDGVGVMTIGYGHTRTVDKLPQCIGYDRADALFSSDLSFFEKCICDYVKVPLNQNQFDALSSFSFNLGCGSLKKSTLLRKLNKGDYEGAAGEFIRWNRAGGKVWQGLTTRRARERWLFEA